MMRISLNGEWKMRGKGSHEWINASVPGSVMHDLLQQNKIEDPFYRDNEDYSYDIASQDYEFKHEFSITDEFLRRKKIILCCEGIDTLSTIFINGEKVASTNNMHRTYEFNVKEFLKKGVNIISIKLGSPVKYIEEKQAENPLIGVEHAIEGYPYLRKAHSMFGWDWGPKIPDLGIWRNISLLGWDSARIDNVHILQDHHKDKVELDVRTQFEKYSSEDIELEVIVRNPDGIEQVEHKSVSITEDSTKFTIHHPELWWPNGYGEQPLYKVKVMAKVAGKEIDSKTYQIGLRTLEVRHEPDEWGKSFEFVVNGISLFAKGANYIPEDSVYPRNSYKRTEQLIMDCIEANFNMIRIWGGGYYPGNYFYELCDKHGLIVWQDFMFACSVYEVSKEFEETVRQEAIDNIKRLRHHASLGIWCGNNEVEEAWENWGWPKRSKYRTDYIKLFEIILPEIVEKYDPQTFYWPSSPSSGGGFDQPNNPNVGDVHYWDVWHGRKPFTHYRKFHFRFCSEFGFQSFPSHKTIEAFTLPEDRNIFSYVMEKHQKNDGANGIILSYIADNFLYPKDFQALLYTSQLLQAEAIKYGVEHWRRNRGRCMGSLYWQLNDCWPVASWSSIDYYGRWKALHYFAKKFYAPILLSIEEEENSAKLYVTNDTLEKVSATVNWKLRKNNSEIIHEGKVDAEIQALKATEVKFLSFQDVLTDEAKRDTYLEAELLIDGKKHSATTVLFTQPKHFSFLKPNIHLSIEETDEAFFINVRTDSFAKYIQLELENADCKFSDNYFDLSADGVVQIEVKKATLSKPLSLQSFKDQLVVQSIYDIAND